MSSFKVDLLSIIIIEYHCIQDIRDLVNHLKLTLNDFEIEIKVVSNSVYSKYMRDTYTAEMPDVVWIFNQKNLGFAGGMNCGIRESKGDYLILMNPDTRIQEGDLSTIKRVFEKNKNLGMIVPKFVDFEDAVQDYCREFVTLPALFNRVYRRVLSQHDVILQQGFDYDCVQQVDWSVGAFMVVRSSVLKNVGLMDEGYFMYVEDMDWCRRFWQAGYSILYYPEIVIRYKGDMKSTSFLNGKYKLNQYTFHHMKSLLRYFSKYGIKRFQPVS